MAASMRAALLHGPGDVRITEVTRPRPGSRDIVLAVRSCGICGTDIGFHQQGHMYGRDTAMPLGHEIAGVVSAAGKEVRDIEPGMPLIVNPMNGPHTIGCGDLERGGFAEYVLVREALLEGNVFLIPEGMSFAVASLAEPFAVGMHAVHLARLQSDSRVCVFGAGPIGLGAVAALRYFGVRDVAVVDPVASRLQLAQRLGARHILCPEGLSSPAEFLYEVHGRASSFGLPVAATDAYLDAAGVPWVIDAMLSCAGQGARLILIALYKKALQVDLFPVVSRALILKGSLAYQDEFPSVVNLLRTHPGNLEELISHRFPLEELPQALEHCHNPSHGAKTIIEPA